MTIDEHIEYIKSQKECERLNSCDECDSQSCFSAERIKLLEELRGWREQDLIRREDTSSIFHEDPILDTAGTCYGLRTPSMTTLRERISRIPKAEPKYSGCGHDMFCEKTDCKGCEAEPKENN